MRTHGHAEKETRRIVRKILHIHGLVWQENLHGKLIADEMGITKFLESQKTNGV